MFSYHPSKNSAEFLSNQINTLQKNQLKLMQNKQHEIEQNCFIANTPAFLILQKKKEDICIMYNTTTQKSWYPNSWRIDSGART